MLEVSCCFLDYFDVLSNGAYPGSIAALVKWFTSISSTGTQHKSVQTIFICFIICENLQGVV